MIYKFKDSQGDEWEISFTGSTVRRFVKELGVNIASEDFATRLHTDIAFLVDSIFVAVMPQAEERSLSDEQFAERLAGESLKRATSALSEAIENFFQSSGRSAEAKHMSVLRELQEKAVSKTIDKYNQLDLDAFVQKEVDAAFMKALGEPGG